MKVFPRLNPGAGSHGLVADQSICDQLPGLWTRAGVGNCAGLSVAPPTCSEAQCRRATSEAEHAHGCGCSPVHILEFCIGMQLGYLDLFRSYFQDPTGAFSLGLVITSHH